MPSRTFFALLNEASNLDVYDMKRQLTVASYTNMDEDSRSELQQNLRLPEDILSDILGDEYPDDPEKLKEAINGN